MKLRIPDSARIPAGARTILPLAIALLIGAATPARAAQPRVKSLTVNLPKPDDLPVARSLMQTQPGARYNPGAVAADLQRLQMLGIAATKLTLAFGEDNIDISLTASEAAKPSRPEIVSLTFSGGVAGVNKDCLAISSQRPSTLFRKRPLNYYALLTDLPTVEALYHARGYLDARVSRVEVDINGATARASIHVTAGPRFVLRNVTVHGNRNIKTADLLAALKLADAAPWTEALRMKIIDRTRTFCRERGYLDATVEVEPKKAAGGLVDLQLTLTESDRCILNNVIVRGAQEHKAQVAKLVTLRRDQIVKHSEITALRRAIEDIGEFASIEILLVPLRDGPAGRNDLVIRLHKVDLAREIGDAEKLYYEMVRNVIRLYNNGGRGLGKVEVFGFFTTAEGRVDFGATIIRPGFARLTLSRKGKTPSPRFTLERYVGMSTIHCSTMARNVRIPAALALKIALLPPANGLPTRIQLAPGLTSGKTGADVLTLGGRCPPAAAYFTEQAALFARTPPKLDEDGTLILPGADGGVLKITLNKEKLPVRIVRQDKASTTTASVDIKLNVPPNRFHLSGVIAPKNVNVVDGFGLLAPALLGLGMPDIAADVAEQGVAKYPKSAACHAARGLVRLATGPPEPGLADLQKATELSEHPAYALLLAETFLQGKRFAEAKAACERAMKATTPKTDKADVADVILGSRLGIRSGLDAMTAKPDDYATRAAIDLALAHVGLREYKTAAELARKLLAPAARNEQAAELLARAELGLDNPKAALDALAKLDLRKGRSRPDIYAMLAHRALGDEPRAAAALTRAIKKSPRLRNLSLLQHQATEIHKRYEPAAAKAALAKIFSHAVMGTPKPEDKARLAAIVNDAYVVRADLDALAAQLSKRDDLRNVPEPKLRQAALNQIIEDMLVIRWAMWRGIIVRDEDVRRAIIGEMRQLGAADITAYKLLLKERGTDFARHTAEIRDTLLKRGAIAAALADKILVRPADVRAAYAKDIARFRVPPTARIRMIALEFARFPKKEEAHRLALALLRRLKTKPGSFAELAREYSHDANAELGGLWENVTKSSLIDPLDKTVFGLKPGETSGVVKTALGCHIIRMEKLEPERTVPLAGAAAAITRSLQETRARAEIVAWIKRLKAQSYIEIFDRARPDQAP